MTLFYVLSKNALLVGSIVVMLGTLLTACNQAKTNSGSGATVATYFADEQSGVRSGGVRMIPIKTPSGTFNVWTKRIGNNPKTKILMLHGGPGGNHVLFESFESYLPAEGIEFIYYDQLGSLNSDHPTDSTLWQTPRFVEEVEQVRQALGLDKDNFYLLGHSWGGILAMEYALKYGQHLKGVIISNMMSSGPDYGAYAENVLAKQMDPTALRQIRAFEANGDYQNPAYMNLLMPNFYVQHFCRLQPWPEAFNRALNGLNPTVYTLMQGPSEFGISGRLATWDRKADLPNIHVPTLVIGATHDTMDPKHMQWMSTQFPNGSFLLCPKGSHCSMWDDQEHYFPGLLKFIRAVESGEKKVAI